MKRIICLSAVLSWLIALSNPVFASVPFKMSYQGMMLDKDGMPVNTPQNLEFVIYDSQTGGKIIWYDSYMNVEFIDGLFIVDLGSKKPVEDEFLADGKAFLEIRLLDTNLQPLETFSPRQEVTSSAYALVAERSLSVSDASVAETMLKDGAVTTAKILDGTIKFEDISANGCTEGQIIKYKGSAWTCAADEGTVYSAGKGILIDSAKISADFGSEAGKIAEGSHNHDTKYALAEHNHDSAYSPATHNHNTLYYTQGETDNKFKGYSVISHNHDTTYSKVSHNHDDTYITKNDINTKLSEYSLSSHNHDSKYAAKENTYTMSNVDTLLLDKSDKSHNHDTNYAKKSTGNANFTARWIDGNTVGTGTLFDNGANIGIGTTNPGARLDINAGVINSPMTPLLVSKTDDYTLSANSEVTGIRSILYSSVKNGGFTLNPYSIIGSTYISNNASDITVASGVGGWAFNVSSGTLPNAAGTYGFVSNNSTGTINSAMGVVGKVMRPSGSIVSGTGGFFKSMDATTNIGIYATAEGGLNNYAGIFEKGNVGIGATTPLQKLHIKGDILIDNGTGSGAIMRPDNAAVGFVFGNGVNASTGRLEIRNATGANMNMVIEEGGNVGIGTTDPVSKLTLVNGDANIVNGRLFVNANQFSGYAGVISNGQNQIVLTNRNDGTGNSYALFAKYLDGYSGEVQAGIWAQYGNIKDDEPKVKTALFAENNGGNYAGYFYGDMVTTGNVGIGINSPGAKLDVAGTLKLQVYTSKPYACDSTKEGHVYFRKDIPGLCTCGYIAADGWKWRGSVGCDT
jgi:hypothetical protein